MRVNDFVLNTGLVRWINPRERIIFDNPALISSKLFMNAVLVAAEHKILKDIAYKPKRNFKTWK